MPHTWKKFLFTYLGDLSLAYLLLRWFWLFQVIVAEPVHLRGPVRGRLVIPYPYISEHIYPLSLKVERQLSLKVFQLNFYFLTREKQ